MSAFAKKIGLVAIILDLFVGVAAAAVLHHGSSSAAHGKMSAARFEQIVAASAAARAGSQGARSVRTHCSVDRAGGWDYYCVSSDGTRSFYNVAADRITQRSDLPSYR